MSFSNPDRLLLINAKIDGSHLSFLHASCLLSYSEEESEGSDPKMMAASKARAAGEVPLHISRVIGKAGADLDPRLWHLADLGLAPLQRPGALRSRIALLRFSGGDFTRHLQGCGHKPTDLPSQALYESLLDQDRIQLQVRVAEKVTAALLIRPIISILPPT